MDNSCKPVSTYPEGVSNLPSLWEGTVVDGYREGCGGIDGGIGGGIGYG